MASRTLSVTITGDPSSFNRSMRGIDKSVDRSEGKLKKFGGVAKGILTGGAIAGAAGLALGVKKSADAAIEAEKAHASMVAQLKASGVSYKDHAKQIDEVIQKHSKLSGLDDEDLQRSFTNIVRVTGDVDKALRLNGLAADFARAKHIDVAKAGELVGKVAGGNTGILGRYGIQIEKGATAQEALGLLQKKFSGQAEAYGKTTQGALDRASVAGENLGETVGQKLTPILAKAADGLVNFVDEAGKLGGPIRNVTGVVRRGYDQVVGAVRRFASRNKEELQTAAQAIRNLGRAAKYVFETIIVPVVRVSVRAIGRLLDSLKDFFSGVVRFWTNLLTGRWSKAWDAFKGAAKAGVRVVINALRGMGEIAFTIVKRVGGQIVKGIVAGLSGLAKAVAKAVVSGITSGAKQAGKLLDKANPFSSITGNIVDDTGDGIGRSGALPQVGAFGGSLMGARPAMRPFAAIGSRFGLGVSSGARPGAITSSGNQSWHATGEAIDMIGPSGGMLNYFKTLKKRFGGRLSELIYTPGGAGIKDGRPHTYTGKVAADHYDHVHVAFDSGRRGKGDGIGYNQLKSLWTKAGGPAGQADTAAAVALAESGGRPGIVNSIGAGGLWQIHPPEPGYLNPKTNARIAVRKFRESGWQPWEAYTGPDGKGSDGPWRKFLRSGGSSRGGSGGSGGSSRPRPYAGPRTGSVGGTTGGLSSGSTVSGGQAAADFGVAEATARADDSLSGLIAALGNELRLKRRRLRRVRRALKRRLKKGTRQRLTEELAQLITDIAELAATLKEYRADAKGGATTISAAEGLTAGVAPEGQGLNAGGTALVDVEAGPTATDYANAAIAEASLTPGLDDDIAATQGLLGIAQGELDAARASGDPRRIAAAIDAWKSVKSSLDALTESVNIENETRQRLIDATESLAAEVKTQNEFSRSVAGIATTQAVRALADVISGQIVGTNLQGRRQTAGNGTAVLIP
jgi:hypothetical protein